MEKIKENHELENENDNVVSNLEKEFGISAPEDETPNQKPKTKRTKKSICRVVVATPSYFVIKKDEEIIRIDKKNNYHRGEEIYF